MMRLIYLVACIEGFATLAVEIIALRLAAPVVGSSSIVTSVFLGIILLALSMGYWRGGKLASKLSAQQVHARIGWYLAGAGVRYVAISFAWEVTLLHWLLETTGAYILTLFLTVLLLFFLPVFFASQTIPLLTQVVPTASKGEAAGTILFASTIGSFLGSVVTSIVLFQYIGVFKTGILVSVALLCVTALWRRKTHPRRVLVVCIASLLLLAWGWIGPWNQSGALRHTDSAYQTIQVTAGRVDDREVRVYRTNGSYASAIFADDLSSPFGYITEALQRSVQLRPQRVLVIGGAGFTYPYQLAQESTTIQHIDVVDVDPAVLEVAEEQFLRTDLPDIVHFHAQPARFFLTQQHEPYDIIFVDAFYGKAIPGQLTTVEFFQDTQEMLAPDGVLMMNAILDEDLDSNLSLHLLGSMQHVFTDIRSLSTSEKKSTRTADAIGNIMLTTRPLHASYARTQASPLVYTDDRRTTERDTVELYW